MRRGDVLAREIICESAQLPFDDISPVADRRVGIGIRILLLGQQQDAGGAAGQGF